MEKPPRLRSRMRTTTTMAQKRRHTKNKRKPEGTRIARRDEVGPGEHLLKRSTKSAEKGGRYQACLSKSMYIHRKANKTISAPR